MKRAKTVEQYINEHNQWHTGLVMLRNIVSTTELVETIKWGAPTYTLESKNVLAIGAFKSYFGLWFFNGALLEDKAKVLVAASEGNTKALRQLRFNDVSEINESLIKEYISEAIANQKAGKVIKSTPQKTSFEIPDELQLALDKDNQLTKSFTDLAPYKQKEYALHIGSAKREQTRLTRLEKVLPMIKEGIGLNDKYRNC